MKLAMLLSLNLLFFLQLNKLNLYNDYLNNYKRAQHTVEKCAKENAQFAQIIEVRLIIKCLDIFMRVCAIFLK